MDKFEEYLIASIIYILCLMYAMKVNNFTLAGYIGLIFVGYWIIRTKVKKL